MLQKSKIPLTFMERTPILSYSAQWRAIHRSISFDQRLEIHVSPFKKANWILINKRITSARHFNAHFNTYLKQIVAEGVWRELVVHTRVTRWDALAVSARVKIITITNQKTAEPKHHHLLIISLDTESGGTFSHCVKWNITERLSQHALLWNIKPPAQLNG